MFFVDNIFLPREKRVEVIYDNVRDQKVAEKT